MDRLHKTLNWAFLVAVFLMVFVLIEINENTTFRAENFHDDISDGWYHVDSNDGEAVTFPYHFPDDVHTVAMRRTLPEVPDYAVLAVKCNYHSLVAYVDGEEFYRSDPATVSMVETDLGHYIALIPLNSEYSGKEIELHIRERHSGLNSAVKYTHLTSMAQYGFQHIKSSFFSLAIAALMLCGALVALVAWLVFWRRKGAIPEESYHPLLWIALFAVSVSVWIASEPHIWGVSTGNFASSGLINYMGLSLMPVSLLGTLRSLSKENIRPLQIVVALFKTLLLTEWLLFLLGIADLSDMLRLLQAACIAAVLLFIFFVVWKRGAFLLGSAVHFGMGVVLILTTMVMVLYTAGGDWMPWAQGAVLVLLASILVNTLLNIRRVINEMTRAKEYKEFALTDIMTGLKSRYAYSIFEGKHKMSPLPEDMCVIVMDINGLKNTNDTFGHIAGDELITGASECIRCAFGDVAECFRMGGDEFLVVLRGGAGLMEERLALFDRLLSQWKGKRVSSLSVSHGTAVAAELPGKTFEELVIMADREMYKHKRYRTAL